MEQHEGVYEQIVEVNNINQGTDFVSQTLVQEIIVNNESNQDSTLNCEMSGIDIMLTNDCVNVQNQCNSNVTIPCNTDGLECERQEETVSAQQQINKNEGVSQMNNIGGNIYESHKEDKPQFVQHDQSAYQENEVNSSISVTNLETDNKEIVSEIVPDLSASVPVVKNELFPALTPNKSTDNHSNLNSNQSIMDNLNEVENKNIKESSRELEDLLLNEKETESFTTSMQVESIESMEIDSVTNYNEVVDTNVVVAAEELQTKPEVKDFNSLCSNNSDVNCKNDEMNSEILSEIVDKAEYPVLVTETITESKIVTNSDDVAVLAEFSSIEYTTTVDEELEEPGDLGALEEIQEEVVNEVKEENLESFKIIKSEPKEVKETAVKSENSETIKEKDSGGSVESTDNNVSFEESCQEPKNNDASVFDDFQNDEEDDLELHLSTQSTDSHRKVIQDIFDDWQDENGEEDNNQSSNVFKEQQDSVEIELQNLLSDGIMHQEQTVSCTNPTENTFNTNDSFDTVEQSNISTPGKTKTLKSEKTISLNKSATDSKTFTNKSPKSIPNYSPAKDNSLGKSPKTAVPDQTDLRTKPRPGVKVPGLHLTSQIASTAEVNEVLKERLREKQKDLVVPKTADIVFMKKITQRLSSQLSAASTAMPPLIPLQNMLGDSESDKNKSSEEKSTELNKSSSATDNKELLAILEGDVDPDWSNLKPQNVSEDSIRILSPGESHNISGSKLDPVIEREIALKQLLELPNISPKKSNPLVQKKNKRPGRPSKASVEQSGSKSADEANDSKSEVISLDLTEEESSKKEKAPKALKENNSQNARGGAANLELTVEESRSGRKRKLTEKAREHELTVKRQKVNKNKTVNDSKKSSQEHDESNKQKSDTESSTPAKAAAETPKSTRESSPSATPKSSQASAKAEAKQTKPEAKHSKAEAKTTPAKPEPKQQATVKAEAKAAGIKGKMTPVKRPKLGLLKKDAPISKRKLAVKNLLRQKMTSKKTVAAAKAKAQLAAKTASSNKSAADKSTSGTPVTKTKKVTEIDKLLQDEGVVNLLYDVEQPDMRKRLVPITKSQKKVMDVEKAERELKLRTKMVRNAVLRLRNSSATTLKISSRSRRSGNVASPAETPSSQPEKKTIDLTKSPKAASTPIASDFIIPAKIRNAADASRIIRRHSSSSFSSASASPRVSIDMPPESIKVDEPDMQVKAKRKLSDASDKFEGKKTKKKIATKADTEAKDSSEKFPPKKELVKKMTRSNISASAAVAAALAKAVPKNKKVPKNKASSESLTNNVKSPQKGQDELSACLAEAASALLSSSSSSRSSSASTNRKKGSTNVSRTQLLDDEKTDVKKLFSNKEINVRQHGHLVQLILTPSAPVSGIRNAITIQVMNEVRDALSILKKDDDCRVVLFTSTGTSFCEGLEVSSLLHSNKEERKLRAEEMATAVKEFIRALAAFNKPIVAGVQGAAIGLGVTMLPLFDLVIASDKATFCTPYGKLGQIAEGAAVLTLSHSLGSAVTNELLLGGRVLTASEALRAGLVTRVLWPDRFQGELLPSLKTMSDQSSQSMEATKALLRRSLREQLNVALESETFLLIEHWCSSECQEALKAYIEEKGQ